MNAADLARLEVARRAYRSAEPNAAEVQAGVRRARLGLRRAPARRALFSKALVVVVLAMGGLAFAKPQALGELVASITQPAAKPGLKQASVAHAAPTAKPVQPVGPAAPVAQRDVAAPAEAAVTPVVPAAASQKLATRPKAVAAEPAAPQAPVAPPAPSNQLASKGAFPASAAPASSNTSEWGRVGQALAQGDESRALQVLANLSESPDQGTRDKADLGRAQLMMANGDQNRACATARSLTNRRAGGHIERQALTLLKSCPR